LAQDQSIYWTICTFLEGDAPYREEMFTRYLGPLLLGYELAQKGYTLVLGGREVVYVGLYYEVIGTFQVGVPVRQLQEFCREYEKKRKEGKR